MITRSVRYDYTWGGAPKAIAAIVDHTGNVDCWRLSISDGKLNEYMGYYVWDGLNLVGDAKISLNQRNEIEKLLKIRLEI